MVYKLLIRNEWKQLRRSSMWEQSLGIQIFLGFIFLIVFAELLAGSIIIAKNFEEMFPDDDPVEKFNSFLLYGFGLGFLMRFFMQKVPEFSIQPYRHLPIRKSVLINYVLGKSLLSFFNFLPVVFFTPFILFQMAPWYAGSQIAGYVLGVLFTVITVNFFSIWFKRSLSGNNWAAGIIALVLVGLGLLDYFGLISLGKFSSLLFTALLDQPAWLLLPLALSMIAYLINYAALSAGLYPEENIKKKKSASKRIGEFSYLKQFGVIGELMRLEIKLLLRNKRPKSTLYFLPVFLFYGLMIYPDIQGKEMLGMLIFIGTFMTGPILIIYGQFLLSWESSYFDGILVHISDFHQYFRAKYYILVGATLAAYILTIPYVYFGTKILLINTAAMLFNVGVGPAFILMMSTNNKKRLDITQRAAFNYQGVSFTQYLMSFPVMVMPLLVYLPFWAFGNPTAGIVAIGVAGIIAFAFSNGFINMAVRRFLNRKYLIAEGFRQKY